MTVLESVPVAHTTVSLSFRPATRCKDRYDTDMELILHTSDKHA
jgi:hypothetical protein